MTERILVVDDDPQILQGYKRALRKHFQLDTAPGGHEALEQISNRGPYAVIVSDMRMPGMDGMELLMRVREEAPQTVRIMLTGNADQQTAVDAVNRGQVFRFLTKPCNPETMMMALEEGLDHYRGSRDKEILLEQTAAEVRDLTDKVSYQSKHDILTGLANRQAFELRLESSLESARREGREHVLCYIDLDNLHVINNSCGTTAGDELLRQVAQLLSSQRRKGDLTSRLGSDEFGLLLGDCSLGEARSLVVDLQGSLRIFRFDWEDHSFEIGASIGLLQVDSGSGGVAAVLNAAETACNVAKDSGQNRIHIGTDQDQHLTQRLSDAQWVERIQKALEEGRFELYYQSIVPVDPKMAEGEHYELLVRLRDEKGEIVPPAAFLPAVEHYRLSPRLDRWVIGTAIDWLSCHPDSLERLAMCSINLSGLSLGNPEVLEYIHELFASNPVPREKICFEVTETAAITHLSSAIHFMKTLKKDGFRFALDDFGSGLSSFGYLKNLPVDFLKIDGMFVRDMERDSVDRAMVKAINEIGHAMGKKTIAEYVENEQILGHLRSLGVDYSQGYLFAPPKPLNELTA